MPAVYEIRANYDRDTIVIYQAYAANIADVALKQQRFAPPFSFHRMTWIKPSFLWLMHRSNWGQKANQQRILAVHITRAGWERALSSLLITEPPTRPVGVILIALVLVLAVLVGITSAYVPSLRAVTMPRFGWVGLISCLNPLFFLLLWFWRPKRATLLGAAFMSFTMGVINAVQLSSIPTVSIVGNEFLDRLHSSWLWSVLSFFVIGIYLTWIAFSMQGNSGVAIKGEQ